MKTDNTTVSKLEDIPNIGKAMAADLHILGIDAPKDLIGKDPFAMYDTLCTITGARHDPCVIDVFMAAVHFMEHGESHPWWYFTKSRKEQMNKNS